MYRLLQRGRSDRRVEIERKRELRYAHMYVCVCRHAHDVSTETNCCESRGRD